MLILNFLPILFFGVVLFCLAGPAVGAWTGCVTFSVVIGGVVPAFAIFGFNRLWLGTMGWKVDKFYGKNADGKYVTEENREPENLLVPQPIPEKGICNIITGIGYLIVAILAVIFH